MFKKGIEGFPYYVGVNSLSEVATRTDRVCVLNILGGESRQVTPVSHAFSGGNVVFGTSPGRRGQVLSRPSVTFRSTTTFERAWTTVCRSTPAWSTYRRQASAMASPSSSA